MLAFGIDLGFAVRRDRIERAGLVDHAFAGLAVVAAGRGEDEAADAGLLGEFGDANAGAMIDVVGEVRPQIAERIVRQCGQMQDGVEAGEIVERCVTRVLLDRRHVEDRAAGRERAARIEVGVHSNDVVAGLRQHRRENGADISSMAGHQYAHASPMISLVGQLTSSNRSFDEISSTGRYQC